MLFAAELVYGGVFRIAGFPQEHMLPVLFIECPRLLFPFARQIIADVTRNGGFPPLMIDPIDFAGMFQQRLHGRRERRRPLVPRRGRKRRHKELNRGSFRSPVRDGREIWRTGHRTEPL